MPIEDSSAPFDELKEFENFSSKTGKEKANAMVRALNILRKQRSKSTPRKLILCENGRLFEFLIDATKTREITGELNT